MISLSLLPIVIAALVIATIFITMNYRTVVPTNSVHIVQSAKKTTAYGASQPGGNVYYKWPAWLPSIGVRVTQLPLSNFDLLLSGYEAYDIGRLPFTVDIMAFFRIKEPSVAAQRLNSFDDIKRQLNGILQSAARAILSTTEIEMILQGRREFGQRFTDEVDKELEAWGIQTVKNIEFMDIRDTRESSVIHNIMAKKKSQIEKESRITVAANMRDAQTAEISAQQDVAVRTREAEETVGKRLADKEKAIGIANAQRDQEMGIAAQHAAQAIKEQERATAEREMAILEVNKVRAAEISKRQQVIAAEQGRDVAIVEAEGEKQKTIIVADGVLESKRREATAIEINGVAHGVAEQAVLMAPVNSQIALAKEIGENEGYQKYLITIKQIEAAKDVGIEQAKALEEAEVKVFATTGGAPADGVKSVMDLFSAKGGLQLGAALEALKSTEVGAEIVDRVTGAKPNGNGTGRRV